MIRLKEIVHQMPLDVPGSVQHEYINFVQKRSQV